MLRTFFLLIAFSGLLFSASSSAFTVRLAICKNSKKLQQAIERFSPALKKTVRTYKRGKSTAAYTIPTKDEKTLRKLLPSYRKFFPDAYVTTTNNNTK